MSQHSISNGILKIRVESTGADLKSLKKVGEDFEYMWQGLDEEWPYSAALLFPFVGRLKNCSYLLKGKKYRMGIHGFAYCNEFILERLEDDLMEFVLNSSADLKDIYPFDFRINAVFRSNNNSVDIELYISIQVSHPRPPKLSYTK